MDGLDGQLRWNDGWIRWTDQMDGSDCFSRTIEMNG